MGDLSETLDVVGNWWLLDSPNHKVSGRLTFDPESGGELTLDGVLKNEIEDAEPVRDENGNVTGRSITAESLEKAGSFERIVGQAGRSLFTLEDCFQTRRTGLFFGPGVATQTLFVNQIFKDVQFEKDEIASAHRGMAYLDFFKYWLDRTGMAEEHLIDRSAVHSTEPPPLFSIHVHDLPDLEFSDKNGCEFRIRQHISLKGDRIASRGLHQDFVLTIEAPDARPVEDLLRSLRIVQDLASIGLDRSASVRHIVFGHPDCFRAYGENKKDYTPIQFYARFTDYSGPPPDTTLDAHDMLFTLRDLGDANGLDRWLALGSDYGGIVNRVVTSRNSKTMYVSDRLLNTTAALEALDRKVTGTTQSSFQTRMARNCELAGEVFSLLVDDPSAWVKVLKSQRDSVAHHLELPIVEITTRQQFLMAESAYYLFVLCILKTADIQETAFESVRDSQAFLHLKRRLRDLDDLATT